MLQLVLCIQWYGKAVHYLNKIMHANVLEPEIKFRMYIMVLSVYILLINRTSGFSVYLRYLFTQRLGVGNQRKIP